MKPTQSSFLILAAPTAPPPTEEKIHLLHKCLPPKLWTRLYRVWSVFRSKTDGILGNSDKNASAAVLPAGF